MALLKQQWRSDRRSLLEWAIAMAALTWLMVSMFDSLSRSGALAQLGEAMKQMPAAVQYFFSGGEVAIFSGFVAGLLYNSIALIVLVIYVALYVPNLISREMDQHNMEFLLSLPVRRTSVIVTRWLGMISGLAVISAAQYLGLVVFAGNRAQPVRYLWADINMFLLLATVGGLIMLVSVFIDDLSASIGISMALSLGLMFTNIFTENATGLLGTLRDVLPFSHFNPSAIVVEGVVPWGNMIGLAVAALVFLGLTIVAFRRKQIAA